MTEKEIVEYLKENRTKGVAFGFMPEEVQKWAIKNLNDIELYKADDTFDDDFELVDINGGDLTTIRSEKGYLSVFSNIVLTLRPDFEPEEKSQGGWVEFDITDKGLFFLEYTDRGGSNVSHRFYWHQWSQFLEYCDIDELKYTVFGGWQYKDCDAWFLTPQIAMQGHFYNLCTKDDEPKPAIPTKIRFWREAR